MMPARKTVQTPDTSFIEQLAQRIGMTANAKLIYGEPVERGGVTIVTVAKAVYGFGGGSGNNDREGGFGGGGGVGVIPVGYIEIKNGKSRFRRMRDPLAYAAILAAVAPVIGFVFWRLKKAFGKDAGKSYENEKTPPPRAV